MKSDDINNAEEWTSYPGWVWAADVTIASVKDQMTKPQNRALSSLGTKMAYNEYVMKEAKEWEDTLRKLKGEDDEDTKIQR